MSFDAQLPLDDIMYAYYHFSGIKQAVDASKRATVYLQQTKESLTKKYLNRALEYLRKVSKAYVAIVPGAEVMVDQAFDSVDNLVDTHGEEANMILTAAYDEIDATLKNGDKDSLATALKVMAILRRRLGELLALATKASKDSVGILRDKFPEGMDKIGERLDELGGLASGMGSEGRRVLDDAQKQAKAIFSAGVSSENLKRASILIKEKTSKLGKDASNESSDEKTSDP